MDSKKDEIILKLQDPKVKQDLLDYGIQHLRLHGSVLRWEENEDSDVDLLYEIIDSYRSKKKTWRGVISAFGYLENLLWKKVDMGSYRAMDPIFKPYILPQAQQLR